MPSPCGRRAAEGCTTACCLCLPETSDFAATSACSSRSDFVASAVSALFPRSRFTNHESLPSLADSFSIFAEAFPHYLETMPQADGMRETEYPHLSSRVCLDYSGVGLFSHSQAREFSSSSSSPASFFTFSYKSGGLKSDEQDGEKEPGFESSIKRNIMSFMKISQDDYFMVSTSNRTTAFRLVAEAYPFHSKSRLLTVYDYESEAVTPMAECARKRGAKVMSASFSWPDLSIHLPKLKKMMGSRSRKKKRGLFVFPLMSRMSGVRYPHLLMKMAQERGWHVALDACTLGPKDMDTMGMALIQPDFIICSFYKVFGENPSGFAGLFVNKSGEEVLDTTAFASSIGGIVAIARARSNPSNSGEEDADTRSFSGPLSSTQKAGTKYEEGEASGSRALPSEIVEEEPAMEKGEAEQEEEIELRGLHHADSLGRPVIQTRLRCIINWLTIALMKLRHPSSGNGGFLVRVYGPEVKFDRGSAISFNVFDWEGEKLDPALVQKLADRNNISLNCGFLQNIWFSDRKHEEDGNGVLEKRVRGIVDLSGRKKKESGEIGIAVASASLSFLANFEDAYRLWAFVAKFLDADFVEKERWRYMALNQRSVEI